MTGLGCSGLPDTFKACTRKPRPRMCSAQAERSEAVSPSGELAFLYVNPSHENQGIGRKLIQFIENKAREMGLDELITLSTQAFTYFQSKGGFAEGTPDDLPPARREKYDQSGRNSKVLVKKLKAA